ncbi:hypothetical protein DFP93_103161 [Aneurinibacillus soli]|uniref:Uncharacterized protein n=1 Tax=Aneurinibacillus soli TaxID=1500254 RepID=A0A0U5B6F4_9BACL|nr:hypothetical protein [Aneurinibacillus soli]PYE62950.1 hypothetical protein DFP93_103161 [Aneurinibacillus soli]BAU28991.1 hypothetical protein CB4_03169 [Aneurinibacillus soli]
MKQTTLIIDAGQVRDLVICLAKNAVRDLTRNQKEKNLDKSEFHTALQSLLLEQARDFCCYGGKEHPLPNLEGNGRKGRAWWTLTDRQLAAVFEFDSTIRMRSLRKLLAVDCLYRFNSMEYIIFFWRFLLFLNGFRCSYIPIELRIKDRLYKRATFNIIEAIE